MLYQQIGFKVDFLVSAGFEKSQHLFPVTVAKSWADVVKLGTKQTQTKAVKRGPPRPLSKRQRRTNNTPKVGVPM